MMRSTSRTLHVYESIRVRCAGKRFAAGRGGWLRLSIIALLLANATRVFGTTLVVKLENDQILLAADTRQARFNPGPAGMLQTPGGDERCKVRALGQIGFAVTGFMEYQSNNSSDSQQDWSAYTDATEAFGKAGDNLRSVAAEWGHRAASHFTVLYEANPGRVNLLASGNPENLLEVAFFAGWDKRSPLLLMELISFDSNTSPVIQVREREQPVQVAAYSSNAITQELIDGQSDRAQSVAGDWDAVAEGIPTNELAWRHVEFYIKKTAALDPGVSSVVDVLSIPAGKPAAWIQKGACY
jgi:hypothetical protein